MYLLDTSVVSELRKVKSGKAGANVCTWETGIPAAHMFLSVGSPCSPTRFIPTASFAALTPARSSWR